MKRQVKSSVSRASSRPVPSLQHARSVSYASRPRPSLASSPLRTSSLKQGSSSIIVPRDSIKQGRGKDVVSENAAAAADDDDNDSDSDGNGVDESLDTVNLRKKSRLSDQEPQNSSKLVRKEGLDSEMERQYLAKDKRRQGHALHHQPRSPSLDLEEMRRLIDAPSDDRDTHNVVYSDTAAEQVSKSAKRFSSDSPKWQDITSYSPPHPSSTPLRSISNELLDTHPNDHTPHQQSINDDDPKLVVKQPPSRVIEWLKLKREHREGEKRVLVSEDRIWWLLHAINGGGDDSHTRMRNIGEEYSSADWIPLERLREAEQRSRVVEERLRNLEKVWDGLGHISDSEEEEEAEEEERQVRGEKKLLDLLNKSRAMDRHFAHMKKFVEDRQAGIKRMIEGRDRKKLESSVSRAPSGRGPISSSSPLKADKAADDLKEHEKHKERLGQVFSLYKELLKLIMMEHSKRVDAEHKTHQLSSQVKRQIATLKRAEKAMTRTALSPIASGLNTGAEPPAFSPPSPSFSSSLEPLPTAAITTTKKKRPTSSLDMKTPISHSLQTLNQTLTEEEEESRHEEYILSDSSTSIAHHPPPPPPPQNSHIHETLSESLHLNELLYREQEVLPSNGHRDLISRSDHKDEFEDLEKPLIEEGQALKGFADADLYAEKKYSVSAEDGLNQEESREYKQVHLDFSTSLSEGSSLASSRAEGVEHQNILSCSPAPSRRYAIARGAGSDGEEVNLGEEAIAAMDEKGERVTLSGENVQRRLAAVEVGHASLLLFLEFLMLATALVWLDFPATGPPPT